MPALSQPSVPRVRGLKYDGRGRNRVGEVPVDARSPNDSVFLLSEKCRAAEQQPMTDCADGCVALATQRAGPDVRDGHRQPSHGPRDIRVGDIDWAGTLRPRPFLHIQQHLAVLGRRHPEPAPPRPLARRLPPLYAIPAAAKPPPSPRRPSSPLPVQHPSRSGSPTIWTVSFVSTPPLLQIVITV